LALAGFLPDVRVGSGLPPSAQTRRSIISFSGLKAEVENIGLNPGRREHGTNQFEQAEGLRHLARAGAVVSSGATNQQHARRTFGARPTRLGIKQSLAGSQPFDREREIWIGKTRPCPGGERGFAASDIRLPGNLLDLRDDVFRITEQGIEVSHAEALTKFLACQHCGRLARVDVHHGRPVWQGARQSKALRRPARRFMLIPGVPTQ